MILTIKTDQPQAEIALFEDEEQVAHEQWHGHKQLSDTLLGKITELLKAEDKELGDVSGVVVFEGPGSFTGLRIGVTVANTLAYGLQIPVVGVGGAEWQTVGVKRVLAGDNDHIVKPVYGGEANITKPRK